jgi:hypothetical protein
LNRPVIDLDEVAYVGGAGGKRALAERTADLTAIVARPAWITAEIYRWWADDLLRFADIIVWLDVAWCRAAWRIVLRHLRASMAGTNRHPGVWKACWLHPEHAEVLRGRLTPPARCT